MSQPEDEDFEPYGHIIYCDDIREEASGKITIVGVYGPDLVLFGPTPATLAKICFIVDLFQPINSELVLQKLEITQPGAEFDELLVEMKFPPQLAETQKKQQTVDPHLRRMLRVQFCHSPFNIKNKGRIRARLVHDQGSVRLASLEVKISDQASQGREGIAKPPQEI